MYFSDEEFECHCPKCEGKHTANKVAEILKSRLEELRRQWGKPIYVSDAYRCPEHNLEVGGVSNSQHVRGLAADIWIDGNHDESCDFAQFVLDSRLFDAVGIYFTDDFVHVDLREGGTQANEYRWDDRDC